MHTCISLTVVRGHSCRYTWYLSVILGLTKGYEAEVADFTVMSLKRLLVYEATKAETAISQKGTRVLEYVDACTL